MRQIIEKVKIRIITERQSCVVCCLHNIWTLFSKEAVNYAAKQLHNKIVLVDGKQLAKLMIDYDLGVSTVATYKVKRIDSDFFAEDV